MLVDKCNSAKDTLCVCDPGTEVVQSIGCDAFDPIGAFKYSREYKNNNLTMSQLQSGVSPKITSAGIFTGQIGIIS